MNFSTELARHLGRIEQGIERYLPPRDTRPARLHQAMRYSLEAGGKRLRPVLVLAAAEAAAGCPTGITPRNSPANSSTAHSLQSSEASDALPAAIAIECLHTYSLIHDDLPCMDNDDLRRGRPTAHKAFDEATALLAGDALLTHAFALLATGYEAQPALAHALTRELADAAGSRRLIGGQMEDLLAEGKTDASPDELEFIHLNKTAAMIEASLVMGGMIGAHAAGWERDDREALLARFREAGRHLGLAFQITDDILDATADTATLGKTAGKDEKTGKTTFVRLHGLPASHRLAAEHTDASMAALRRLPFEATFLLALFERMARRAN